MSQPDESTGELAEPTPPPADHEQTKEPVTEPAQETDHSHTKEGGDMKEEHREEEHKPQENGDYNAATKASDSQPPPEAVREVKFEDESKADSIARDGPSSGRRRVSNDKDAQAMVIDSLRSQVQDLISQVTALNGKLVKSYDRVSDLEDALHVSDSNLRSSTLKISQLELERTQHLSALDTGLLVEKAQVTSELTRLMEKATDEAARRGQAESARHEIEQELDDLSAGLFDQANTMVAEARFARARSERKAEDTERALKETEEVVGLMQKQMQALQEEKEDAERRMEEMNIKMGKGKWVERTPSPSSGDALHLLSSHQPYHEFMMFVAHLRSLRPNSPQVPAMSTLLPLPFLSRLLSEDTDPTVRLDLAPSLNWLTRRSVISAIHNGQLSIEPIPAHALLEATHPSLPVPIPVSNNQSGVSCALCGTSIFPPGSSNPGSPTRPGHSMTRTPSGTAWPSTLFKNPLSSNLGSAPPSPPPYQGAHHPPTQIYIFRLAVQTNSALPAPIPNSPQARSQSTMYPLCTSGWCLTRLRTTCSLWAFVRTGIVERVWDEASAQVLPPSRKDMPNIPAPPVPPRRKSKMSGLWSALGGWSENDKEKEKEKEAIKAEAYLLTRRGTVHEVKAPPPLRHKEVLPPPPLHPAVAKTEKSAAVPPPLPKRSVSRQHPVPPAEPHVNGMEAPAPPSVNGDSVNGDSVNGASINGDSVNGHDGKLSVESETRSVSPITAPDESEVHSKDAFLTPTEQPSSPVSAPRSGSPSTIPLPDSGRSTPDFSEPSNEDEPVAAKSNTESSLQPEESTNAKHAEPATEPTTTVNALTNEENAPSRTGSPAPPPLPRRAPARNRPVPPPPPPRAPGHHGSTADSTPEPVTTDSMPTPEPVSSVSPSPDPAAPTSESSSKPAADDAVPAEKEDEEAPANGPTEPPADDKTETVQASADDATSDHKSVEDEDEEPQPVNGISVQPPTPAADDADDAASTAAVNEITPPATPELPPPPPPATSEFPPPPKRAIPPALPPRRSLDRTSSLRSSSDSQSQSQSQKQLNGADGEAYVGDATWEERTWKEVVRLREDMFWARVGGVR